jgi:hypothetical protein
MSYIALGLSVLPGDKSRDLVTWMGMPVGPVAQRSCWIEMR